MAAIVKDYLKALVGVAAAGAATAIAITIVIAILRFDLVALLYG